MGTQSARQRAATTYGDSLKERFKHHPEIKRISRHRHVPKQIYTAKQLKATMENAAVSSIAICVCVHMNMWHEDSHVWCSSQFVNGQGCMVSVVLRSVLHSTSNYILPMHALYGLQLKQRHPNASLGGILWQKILIVVDLDGKKGLWTKPPFPITFSLNWCVCVSIVSAAEKESGKRTSQQVYQERYPLQARAQETHHRRN